jgi:hypothetical protein
LFFYAAEYTRLRGGLVRAAQQLNLRKAGRLASAKLGRWALQKAASGAVDSSVCNFFGALFPLLGGEFLPRPVWLAVALTTGALGVLGAEIAHTVHGSRVRWGAGLDDRRGCTRFCGHKTSRNMKMNDLLNWPQCEISTDGAVELPEEVLKEIRLRGLYDEVALDPVDGHVLSRLRVEGAFDSYSDTYILNGRSWKVKTQMSLPGGGRLYRLVCVDGEG